MEAPSVPSSEDLVETPQASVSPKASSINSVQSVKRNSKIVKSGVPSVPRASATSVSSRKSANGKAASDSTSSTVKSTLTKPTISSSAASLKRRNSTGGVLEKKSTSLPKQEDGAKSLAEKRITRSVSGQSFQSLAESRRASLPSVNAKTPSRTSSSDAKKPSPVSPAARDSRTLPRSEINKLDTTRKPSQRSCSYKVRFEDTGRYLRCECTVTDVFGRSSEPASAVTPPILPGMPKVDKLEIEGRGFHTNLYAVRGTYSGGKEGKSRIQWLRSMVGSPDLISIPGEEGRMYEANVDDVGYRLVAIYTPVREDGVEGQPVSASTEPIAVEPDVHKEVKQKLDLGSVKFEALCDRDRSLKKGPGVGTLERRILEVNRKRVKVVKPGSKTSFPATEIRGSYAPPFHVELFRNDQHRLKIVVDSENEVDLMVQTRHMRDVIVLVIRGLAQRFNSTSLNSLLKIET